MQPTAPRHVTDFKSKGFLGSVYNHTTNLEGKKYSTRPGDSRVERVLYTSGPDLDLIAAAYADSTWDRLVCVLNTLEKCENDLGICFTWPLNDSAIANFIKWSSHVKKHSPNTTATVHTCP